MTDEPAFYEICAHCGDRLTLDEWPPIVVEAEDADGDISLYSFCDEECKRAWDPEG